MESKKYTRGFKVPKEYFENFEDQLFTTLIEEKLPENNGFKVPESYFVQVEDRVMRAISVKKKPTKVISLRNRRIIGYVAAVAACVVLVVSIFTKKDVQSFDNLQEGIVTNYIEDGNLDFNTLDVVALLNENDVNNLDLPTTIFSEENIEDYLLEDIDDTVELINFE